MTKAEKIKEAYGEYWDLFFLLLQDRIIFNNGNLDYFLLPKNIRDATEKICDIRSHKSIFECTKTDEATPRFFRPKSLRGIENNNGWIKIESEENLPKQENNLWLLANDGSLILGRYCMFSKTYKTSFGDNFDSDGIIFTHYQNIEKPKLPMF